MAWVYVVQNSQGRFYIGMTTDLDGRLRDHNSGVSKWTKHRGPWKLVWSQERASISEARKLEMMSEGDAQAPMWSYQVNLEKRVRDIIACGR
jgi:predicted GIY-YIG superfamily endonuclease